VRILRPGGSVLVLDLREHEQDWVRTRFGDRHLGFSPEQLDTLLRDAGLTEVRVDVGARKKGDPFTVLIASGIKAAPGSGVRGSAPGLRAPGHVAARTVKTSPEARSATSGA
jgi:hypothetical protein